MTDKEPIEKEKKPEDVKPEEQKPEGQPIPETEELKKRVEHLEAERLAAKKAELLEIESRLDRKMADFKKFVADTEVQGRSLAVPEQTDEEKATEAANKLLEGTGFKI